MKPTGLRKGLINLIGTGVLVLASCAHAPPPELEAARQTYQRVSMGPAARVVPAEVHKARAALALAEQMFADEPDSQRARDLAYVAERKALTAEALGDVQLSAEAKRKADRDYLAQQNKQAQQTKRELNQARAQLQQNEQLTEQERQGRVQAERKAADAAKQAQDALSKLASVKQEPRGTVITLSGSVLFASNESALLPEARQRLNQVAEALMATPDRVLIIEGYTDSRGTDALNADLSQRRAEAVRNHLISCGYPADKIQSFGLGKTRPVGDNATADGRANNRRVEIVIQEKGAATATRPHDNL